MITGSTQLYIFPNRVQLQGRTLVGEQAWMPGLKEHRHRVLSSTQGSMFAPGIHGKILHDL